MVISQEHRVGHFIMSRLYVTGWTSQNVTWMDISQCLRNGHLTMSQEWTFHNVTGKDISQCHRDGHLKMSLDRHLKTSRWWTSHNVSGMDISQCLRDGHRTMSQGWTYHTMPLEWTLFSRCHRDGHLTMSLDRHLKTSRWWTSTMSQGWTSQNVTWMDISKCHVDGHLAMSQGYTSHRNRHLHTRPP